MKLASPLVAVLTAAVAPIAATNGVAATVQQPRSSVAADLMTGEGMARFVSQPGCASSPACLGEWQDAVEHQARDRGLDVLRYGGGRHFHDTVVAPGARAEASEMAHVNATNGTKYVLYIIPASPAPRVCYDNLPLLDRR